MVIGEAAKRLNLTRTVFLLSVAREHAEHVPGKKTNPGRGGMPAALVAGIGDGRGTLSESPPRPECGAEKSQEKVGRSRTEINSVALYLTACSSGVSRSGFSCGVEELSHVRSLRASFIQMLCHFSEEKEYLVIFGESDACPVMEANRIKTALQRELAQHPETDVFRLFHDAQWSRPTDIPKKDPIMFDDFQTGSKDANNPYVWGTHALVIPSKSRAKVARIFADYRLPIDIALEAANTRGELKIRHTTINPFYQKKRTGGQGTLYRGGLLLRSRGRRLLREVGGIPHRQGSQ